MRLCNGMLPIVLHGLHEVGKMSLHICAWMIGWYPYSSWMRSWMIDWFCSRCLHSSSDTRCVAEMRWEHVLEHPALNYTVNVGRISPRLSKRISMFDENHKQTYVWRLLSDNYDRWFQDHAMNNSCCGRWQRLATPDTCWWLLLEPW